MTAQIAEILCYDGHEVSMCTEPLDDYFSLAGTAPEFQIKTTALWRGYVGTWEIRNDRLYLIGLSGTLKDGSEVNVATLFPDYPDRVYAHWYSGILRVPQGKLLEYVHGGYASSYEKDLMINIDRGVVTATNLRHNGTSDNPGATEGYIIGARTVFPGKRLRKVDGE